MSENAAYRSGKETHHMKGTVIPSATNHTDEVGRPVDAGSLGTTFDIQKAVPMNIVDVEIGSDGFDKYNVRQLDANALDHLQRSNAGRDGKGHHIGYDEAIGVVKGAQAGSALDLSVTTPTPTPPPPQLGQPARATLPAHVAYPAETQQLLPKTMVRFEGAFGRFRMGYDRVFVDNGFLVLIQNVDSSGYEAPAESDEHMKVEIKDNTYWCLASIQYTIPNGPTHTVFIIDEGYDPDALEEASNGDGEAE